MNVSQQTAKKFGFWTALSMVIGSVVGIGIFLKNNSIFSVTDGNALATLLAWIFGGVVSLLCALSFAEISKSATDTNGGLGDYAKKYIGVKFSNFVKVNYSMIYFGILSPALSYFTYIFLSIGFEQKPTNLGIMVSVIAGPLLTTLIALFSPRLLKTLMNSSVIVKFLPLLLAAFAGIWTSNNGGTLVGDLPGEKYTYSKSTFDGLLLAMPMVLFAFDAFLSVGSIAKNVKNSEKNVPLAVFAGMIFVSAIYILITISQLRQNSGTVSNAIESALGTSAFTRVVSVIIAFSAIGTTLSVGTANNYIAKDLIESDLFPFSKKIVETYKGDHLRAGAVISSVTSLIFGLAFSLTTYFVGGGGDMLDEMSNLPSLFFYGIYAIVMLGFTVSKWREGKFSPYIVYLLVISVLASIGIALIVGYQFYNLFDMLVETFKNTDGQGLPIPMMIKIVSLILYTVLFATLPFAFMFIKQKFEHKQSYGKSFLNAFELKNNTEDVNDKNDVDILTKIGFIISYISGAIMLLSIIMIPVVLITFGYFKEIKNGDNKARIIAGILSVLFFGLIPGILILIGKNKTSISKTV